MTTKEKAGSFNLDIKQICEVFDIQSPDTLTKISVGISREGVTAVAAYLEGEPQVFKKELTDKAIEDMLSLFGLDQVINFTYEISPIGFDEMQVKRESYKEQRDKFFEIIKTLENK